MNKERLLNVARALRESGNPEKFTMSKWGHSCGTPACALGHYARRVDLQNEFALTKSGDLMALDGERRIFTGSDDILCHFGLDDDEAEALFGSYGCGDPDTAAEAATYIERFVKRYAEDES